MSLSLMMQHWYSCMPQVPGDGRELVVTDPNAVTIRAEDGRRVAAVNITPFINNLPYGKLFLTHVSLDLCDCKR